MRLALSLLLAGASLASPQAQGTATALYCEFGGVGITPTPVPPGYERYFAVAVVEIDSPNETKNVEVSDFSMFEEGGAETKLKRVGEVEEFNRVRLPTQNDGAYYMNPGGTRPWNGILPAGTIRLRVRVALVKEPVFFNRGRFRLTIGSYVIEGPVNAEWPT
jgi:hypothetical protein